MHAAVPHGMDMLFHVLVEIFSKKSVIVTTQCIRAEKGADIIRTE